MPARRASSSRKRTSRAAAASSSGYRDFEKERADRLAWCKANTSVEDDVKKYFKKGKEAWSAVSDWWNGKGDYEILSNSLILGGTKSAMQPLVLSNQRNGGEIRIKFREYLGDVRTHPTTVGAWYNVPYTLNAANQQTFPWLSTLAMNYEQWQPNGIIFEFRSTATEYSTSANLGSVVMATDYDYSDTDYATKLEALNSAYAMESKVSADVQMHGVECMPSSNPTRIFYCSNSTAVPAGTSVHEYFLGKFQIATSGSSAAANSVVGSLYINYDITFRKPQFTQGVYAKQILFDHFVANGTINQTLPLGNSSMTRSTDSNLQGNPLLDTYYFPPQIQTGLWRVTWGGLSQAAGATAVWITPQLQFTNCVAVTPEGANYNPSPSNAPWGAVAGQQTAFAGSVYILITAANASVKFANAGGANFDLLRCYLWVEQANSLLQ